MTQADRVAVVTGASEGLGEALASHLGAAGYRVALVARTTHRLQQVVDGLAGRGIAANIYPCDLANREQLRETFDQLLHDHGHVDVLCNNAGVGRLGPFLESSIDDIVAPIDVPTTAALLATRLLAPSMVSRGAGTVVNIVSPAAYFELPYMAAYTAARWALLGFSRSLDEELRGSGVRVRAVCPAWIDTRYLERNCSVAGWFPRIASWFPRHSPDQVAARVVARLDSSAGEQFLSGRLFAFAWCYRHFPRMSRAVLKITGLYRPTVKREPTT